MSQALSGGAATPIPVVVLSAACTQAFIKQFDIMARMSGRSFGGDQDCLILAFPSHDLADRCLQGSGVTQIFRTNVELEPMKGSRTTSPKLAIVGVQGESARALRHSSAHTLLEVSSTQGAIEALLAHRNRIMAILQANRPAELL